MGCESLINNKYCSNRCVKNCHQIYHTLELDKTEFMGLTDNIGGLFGLWFGVAFVDTMNPSQQLWPQVVTLSPFGRCQTFLTDISMAGNISTQPVNKLSVRIRSYELIRLPAPYDSGRDGGCHESLFANSYAIDSVGHHYLYHYIFGYHYTILCLMATILGYQLYDVSVDYFAFKTVTLFDVMDNSMNPHLPHITLVYQSIFNLSNTRQCLRTKLDQYCKDPDVKDRTLFNYTNIDSSGRTRIALGNKWPGVDIRSLKRLMSYGATFEGFALTIISVILNRTSIASELDGQHVVNSRQFAVIRRWSEAIYADPMYVLLHYKPVPDIERLFSGETELSAVNHTLAVTKTMRQLLPSPYGRCSDYGSDPSTGAEGDGSGQPFRAISHFHCMRRCRLSYVRKPPTNWCEVSVQCMKYCPPDCVAMDYRSRVVNDNKDYIQKVWFNDDRPDDISIVKECPVLHVWILTILIQFCS
ncbi:unnamed protein product [Medioppia subpectinata]|uniref:Uncharacterized protein n=1 Tax=Medioppia subpectinata TaxID=1979941 RepID=A0A7R9KMH2_9ACAR|nr:unnamed protein product [Medioppia subpectinata]CAG2105985.1 unnamed protein product [Medioppia subpectinata]